MTTNDLITLIIKDHSNADSLAQLAMAIECLQEQAAAMAAVRERMKNKQSFYTELDELVTQITDKHNSFAYTTGALVGAIKSAIPDEGQIQKEILNTLETVLSY